MRGSMRGSSAMRVIATFYRPRMNAIAIYDALIAESARLAGATLVTADRRAAATYRVVGVEVEVLGD